MTSAVKLSSEMNDDLLKEIMELIESFSTPPTILTRILELTDDPDSRTDKIADVLAAHPSIAAPILQLANSAFYGLSRTVSSINHAVVMLGMRTIRSLIITTTTQSLYKRSGSTGEICDKMWKHSLATAIFSRLLAIRNLKSVNPEDAYIAGLLHDLGKLVLLERFPSEYVDILQIKSFDSASLLKEEIEAFGFSHPIVGAMLAESWRFPELIVRTIASHHGGCTLDSLSGLVGLANIFVTVQGYNSYKASPEQQAVIDDLGWEKEPEQLAEMLNEQLSVFS